MKATTIPPIALCVAALFLNTLHGTDHFPDDAVPGSRRGAGENGAFAAFTALRSSRIYFGHQSVGYDIVEGIREHAATAGCRYLTIAETTAFPRPAKGIFAHSRIGTNRDPFSKIDDFRRILDSGLGGRVDIACFKLCYVDIDASTDLPALFIHYVRTMAYLRAKYPRVTFIPVTVPLRAAPAGPGAFLRRLLALPLTEDDDNIQRNRFNEMLLRQYARTGPVFDLAGCVSSPVFRRAGRRYRCLDRAYTYDGGHLNEAGRRATADEFLRTLGEAAGSARKPQATKRGI